MTADRLVPTSATPGPVTGDDYMDKVQEEFTGLWNRSICSLTDIDGTPNAITATLDPALTAGLIDGMSFWFTPTANNTGAATIAINGDSAIDIVDINGNPLANGALANGRKHLLVADSGALRVLTSGGGAAGGGVNVVVFTSSGTYNKPDGLRFAEVLARGAGGGSGGKSNVNTSTVLARGAGGGAGGEATKFLNADDISSTTTVTVGAGGSAGGTGDTAVGGTGGTSSFGTHCVATGGDGGRTYSSTQNAPLGGAGGMGTAGDVLMAGYPGENVQSAGYPQGAGGGSPTGGGGPAARSTVGVGVDGFANTGTGAAGGANGGSNTQTGGVGGTGIVIIREYY